MISHLIRTWLLRYTHDLICSSELILNCLLFLPSIHSTRTQAHTNNWSTTCLFATTLLRLCTEEDGKILPQLPIQVQFNCGPGGIVTNNNLGTKINIRPAAVYNTLVVRTDAQELMRVTRPSEKIHLAEIDCGKSSSTKAPHHLRRQITTMCATVAEEEENYDFRTL